jgi:hypothetical protein
MMARYRILSWRGIPAQLKVFSEEGRPRSIALDKWFATEIDRVAMREGLVGTDAYLDQFAWSEDLDRPGTADEVASELVAELDAAWVPGNRPS